MRRIALVRISLVLVTWIFLGAGCGAPLSPKTSEPPAPPSAEGGVAGAGSPASERAVPSARPTRSTRPPSPSPTGFNEFVAVACNGRPSADQVIASLRRSSVLPAGVRPTVATGPLCSGTWQYTVLNLPDREPLYVVTRGRPEALVVETAGTNPCTAQVRANAPAGIVGAIRC